MQIIDLVAEDESAIQQAAKLLVAGFREHWPRAWPDLDSALEEVHEALAAGKIARIAIDEAGTVLGWIGGKSEYYGQAWELHPLVVDPAYQGQGIGAALVADLEVQVKKRGGITIFLGTDDEDQMTTLSNTDLYPNILEQIENIQNLHGHPFTFYQKRGYTIVGVIPDANGLGKPDILMAKRVGE
jgi:aminoglycoside 6'-N-acetyltransferase I